MTDDELALIATIRADRDSDAPRLVYTDWLDEHDRSVRAEFIRVQCWLSAHPMSHPDWDSHWYREQELLLNREARGGQPHGHFHRGFVTSVDYSHVDDFLAGFGQVCQTSATDRVGIHWVLEEMLPPLLESPLIQELRGLWLGYEHGYLCGASINRICQTPHLQQLRELYVPPYGMDLDEYRLFLWRLLTERPILPELRYFAQHEDEVPLSTVVEFLNSPHRQKIDSLTLYAINGHDLNLLFQAPCLQRIRCLILEWTILTDEVAQSLLESPYLDQIEHLEIRMHHEARRSVSSLLPRLQARFGTRLTWDRGIQFGIDRSAEYIISRRSL